MSQGGRSVATIERAVDVLFLFTRAGGDLGVTEIANELDISKAVVHRILTSLRDRDLISADESRRYSLGPAVLELAAAYQNSLDIRSSALEAMRELSAITNETATMSVHHGDSRVCVEQITPAREVKMIVRVGSSFPLHAGATGKAFLAWLTEEEQEEYLAGDLESITSETSTDPVVLRRELDQIRQQGFAVSMGERQAGAASVAAPVLDHRDVPVAVIGVCGPVERFRDGIADAAKHVVEATRELNALLGVRP